jgi:hypothetical protein
VRTFEGKRESSGLSTENSSRRSEFICTKRGDTFSTVKTGERAHADDEHLGRVTLHSLAGPEQSHAARHDETRPLLARRGFDAL